MGVKHDLKNSIQNLLRHNRDGSFATQSDRKQILLNFAEDLVGLGFGLGDIHGLKQKHILAIVKHWQANNLAIPTIKNRTSALRYLCRKINKPNIVPTNKELQIGNRQYTPKFNRAIFNPDFSKITNSYIRVSLELQRVFGLRREEALKIKPHIADKGDKLELLPTWCKGGRGRSVPIRTDEQRFWLERAKEIAGKFGSSLIPQDKNYIQHRWVYEKQVQMAGLKNLHGLRHAYAQQCYKELTGWEAPINGGPKAKELTPEQKQIDYQARLIISELMGHGRERVTVNYLSR